MGNDLLKIGGAVAGAGLIALLIKAFASKRRDPRSRLISTLSPRAIEGELTPMAQAFSPKPNVAKTPSPAPKPFSINTPACNTPGGS